MPNADDRSSDLLDRAKSVMGETLGTVKHAVDAAKEHLPDASAISENAANLASAATNAATTAAATVTNAAATVTSAATAATSAATTAASHVAENASELVGSTAKRGYDIAQQNPLGLLIGGVAIGFLAGLVVPVTDFEREKVGPIRDDLVAKGKLAAKDAIDERVASVKQTFANIASGGM